jgi:hypothetical protein
MKVRIDDGDAFEYPEEFRKFIKMYLTELEVLIDGQ